MEATQSKQKNPKQFVCKVSNCGKVFANRHNLTRHHTSKHQGVAKSDQRFRGELTYQCDDCKKYYSTIEARRKHACIAKRKSKSHDLTQACEYESFQQDEDSHEETEQLQIDNEESQIVQSEEDYIVQASQQQIDGQSFISAKNFDDFQVEDVKSVLDLQRHVVAQEIFVKPQLQAQNQAIVEKVDKSIQLQDNDLLEIEEDEEKLEELKSNEILNKSQFLKAVYHYISKKSNDMWGIIDSLPDPNQQPVQCTRAKKRIQQDSIIEQSEASLGYGEATLASIEKVIAIFKKIGIDYDSSFLDIGSGFGKVVIHFACETNADCWGYEIVTARCQQSERMVQEIENKFGHNAEVKQILSRVHFLRIDCANVDSFQNNQGQEFTHLFCFNKVMSDANNRAFVNILNNTHRWQVFAWCKDKRTTIDVMGLKNAELFDATALKMTGSGERSTLYVYKKTQLPKQAKWKDKAMEKYEPSQNLLKDLREKLQFAKGSSNSLFDTICSYNISTSYDVRERLNALIEKAEQRSIKLTDVQSTVAAYRDICDKSSSFIIQALTENDLKEVQKLLYQIQLHRLQTQYFQEHLQQFKNNYDQLMQSHLIQEANVDREQEINDALIFQKHKCQQKDNFIQKLLQKEVRNLGFNIVEMLASGGQGIVYKCSIIEGDDECLYDQFNAEYYALKISLDPDDQTVQNEIQFLQKLNEEANPFIVKYICQLDVFNQTALVMEYLPKNLEQVYSNLTQTQSQLIAYGLMQALAICHKLDIAHRDLKLENVMLNDKYVPKIVDWGLANVLEKGAGTPGYMAPETYDANKRMNIRKYQKGDMFQAGIIIYYLVEKVSPFSEEQEKLIESNKLVAFKPNFRYCTSQLIQQFIINLLEFETQKRYSPEEALQHPWMKQVNIPLMELELNFRDSNIYKRYICKLPVQYIKVESQ